MIVEVEVTVRLRFELEDEPAEDAPKVANEIVEEALAEFNSIDSYDVVRIVSSRTCSVMEDWPDDGESDDGA